MLLQINTISAKSTTFNKYSKGVLASKINVTTCTKHKCTFASRKDKSILQKIMSSISQYIEYEYMHPVEDDVILDM